MGKKRVWIVVAVLVAMAVALTAAGCGSRKKAGTGGRIEYKLVYHLPASHPLAKSVTRFAERVKEKTHGQVTLTPYPAGQLYNDKTMNDALITGGIDLTLNTVGRWATVVPAMEVFDVPFVFPSYQQIDRAIDGGMGKFLEEELAKRRVRVVYWADYGFVQFANNKRPIRKPADFAGLKIRGYSEMSSQTIKALGGSPVTMGSGEVYMALQRGTIDGQTSGTSAMRDRKTYEVTKYLTISNHASPEFILAMNDHAYARMSPEQRQAFDEAARETRDEIRRNAKAMDLKGLHDLQAHGMEVYEIPPQELQQWRDAAKPVWDIFLEHTGETGRKLLDLAVHAG
ncbi:MAG: TRAP transporter solute receptor, DctP family [Succiniclasticum sp.]|jgi:tripartite ATP-independent transporter DctP family solute receptor